MKLRIPNGTFWLLALALGSAGCNGDGSSPTSPSSQPGPSNPSSGSFSLSLEVSNSNARASTAASPGLRWTQTRQDDEVQIEVNVSENGGQTGAVVNDIEIHVLNSRGRVIRNESVPLPSNRLDPGASWTVTYSLPRLNTNAEKIEAVASLTTDGGVPTSVSDEATAPFPKNCANGEDNACLNNGRFHVSIEWENAQGETGVGHKFGQHDYRGEFWFFSPDNVDLIVDVLDGCSVNDHFWVFTAGDPDVGLDLVITDSITGDSMTYSNPPGGFRPIEDTSAFATCP